MDALLVNVVMKCAISADSVDDSGLRFVLAMRNFTYLSKCLPPKEKAELNSQGLT